MLFRSDYNLKPVTVPLFHGLLTRVVTGGEPTLSAAPEAPRTLPCPTTGRPLAIAAIDTNSQALCPRCLTAGRGAFISFVSDLRLAYACPSCEELVWGEGL